MNMLSFHFLFCRRDPSFLVCGSGAAITHHDAVRALRRAVPCAGSAVWCERVLGERVLLWGVLGEMEKPLAMWCPQCPLSAAPF